MKWFGLRYGAPYESDCEHIPTPIGEACRWCGETFDAHSDGVSIPVLGSDDAAPYHYECHLRQIVGGLNHLQGKCSCCGGTEPPDPPDRTRRQAATEAALFHLRGRR